jgi:hypothetical protein
MLTRESYVKHNSLMLVQGNVGRIKKLGVVVGKSGRSLGVVRTYDAKQQRTSWFEQKMLNNN